MPPKRRAAQQSSPNNNKQAKMSQGDVSGAGWEDLPAALEKNKAVSQLNDKFANDGQFQVSLTYHRLQAQLLSRSSWSTGFHNNKRNHRAHHLRHQVLRQPEYHYHRSCQWFR